MKKRDLYLLHIADCTILLSVIAVIYPGSVFVPLLTPLVLSLLIAALGYCILLSLLFHAGPPAGAGTVSSMRVSCRKSAFFTGNAG